MPGRLLNMERNGTEGAKVMVNGKHSPAVATATAVQAATATPKEMAPAVQKRAEATVLTNGNTAISSLGAYPTPNGLSPASPNNASMASQLAQLPDELIFIAENFHVDSTFHSLGTLVSRVTQECFKALDDTVDQLEKINVHVPPTTNGTTTHAPPIGGDTSPENKQKKKLLLEFASDFRAKFIKLLVILQWSRDANEARKLINLNHWLNDQMGLADASATYLAEQLIGFRSFKIPNPDLETALAVLSTGDVPWIPHMNFRPQKPLTAKEILRTMEQMNTLVNLRLVLHEDLIPQLRNYRVADGRATFAFPDEFELDVYVSSEDNTEQFWFLDVRFLFEPAPQIRSEFLRGRMDLEVNRMLGQFGLRGTCDFLHGFSLTHKIGILLRQAIALRRGIWSSALKIEQVHRMLVLQYWVESPQAKSWIEIGISTGKPTGRRKRTDNAITSLITARWMRNGKVVKGAEVPLDLKNLSIERYLNMHIARHSSMILESIRDKLEQVAEKRSSNEHKLLVTELTTSDIEPRICRLQAKLGGHPTTNLCIDSITGRLYLDPGSLSTVRAQHDLERMKDPSSDAHELLKRYLTYDIQCRTEHLADIIGWDFVRNHNLKPKDLEIWTKREVQRFLAFQPRGWKGSDLHVVQTINLCGECWWTMELKPIATGKQLVACRPLPTAVDGLQPPLSQELLRKIEQLAVRTVSYYVTDKDLTEKGINSSLRFLAANSKDLPFQSPQSQEKPKQRSSAKGKMLPHLMVRFSQLLNKHNKESFAGEMLQLSYLGFDRHLRQVTMVAKGRMKQPADIQDILQHTKDAHIGFSADGSFSVILRTKLGESCVNQMVARLATLSTLCNFATVLKQQGLECKHISFTRVCFTYAGGSHEITLLFTDKRTKLDIAASNPHRRVAALLEGILNDSDQGFERFVRALDLFLPVLRAFQALDCSHVLDFPRAPIVHPRTVDSYRLCYPNPASRDPHVVFDISFKRNRDDLEWRICDATSQPAQAEREKLFPGFNQKLLEFMKTVGTGWTGMNTMIVADKNGIEDALLKLDNVIWGAMDLPRVPAEEKKAVKNTETRREVIMID